MSDKNTLIKLRQYVDQRLLSLRVDRSSYWQHWRQLSDYLLPRRGRFLVTANSANRGSQVGQKIINSSGTLALRTLSAGLMAGLTSPARPWFRLAVGNMLNDSSAIRLWLDEVAKRMLAILSQSNIYNCLHVVYEELGAFGTAVMLLEEDFESVIRGQMLTAGEYYLGMSGTDRVDTLYREYVYTVAALVDRFGIENVSETVRTLYENNGPGLDKEVCVAQAIEPNDKRSPQAPSLKGKKWRSVCWEIGTDAGATLEIKGYHEFPVCAPRWHVNGNEAYGRSPGMDALGDLKQIQKLSLRIAQAIDKILNPPMVADASMRNEPASLLPGGVTYVPNLVSSGFKPAYRVPPDVRFAFQEKQECITRVDEIFFKTLFLMISQLDTVRTATEIIERKQEKYLMLGPFLERSQFELIDPLIDRLFGIMLRNGLIPPAPREIAGSSLEVECISTLADAQKATATTGIERLVAFVGNLMAGKQDVIDTIDFDETVDEYAALLGVTPKILTSDDVRKAARESRQKMEQSAIAAQNATAAAQAGKTLSETDVGGGQNALQRMIGVAP